MKEYFGWGFPTEKLKQRVFVREPDSPGTNPGWCLDTSADGSCSSGVMVRPRRLVAWTPSALQCYEFAQMQHVRRTDRPDCEQLSFVYAGQPVSFEFPRASHFFWDVVAKFAGSVEPPYPELSNVCECRLPEQTNPLLRLFYMFFAGGKVLLSPRVTSAEQAAHCSYRKAWFTIDDDSLFFTVHRGQGSYEQIVHRQPLSDIQSVVTQPLPTNTRVQAAFVRNLPTAAGIGAIIIFFLLVDLSGEKAPAGRMMIALLGSFLSGLVMGFLMLMLPDLVRARQVLTLWLLKLSDGGFLAVAADAKQQPQFARLLASLAKSGQK